MTMAPASPGPRRFRAGWFLFLFVAIYAALHAAYFRVPDAVLREVVHFYAIVWPGAAVIQLASPGAQVVAVQGTLRSPKATLNVVRGCDGAGVVFLMIAAVVAFAAGWKQKLLGIGAALLLTYLLNQVRVVVLYFVAAYRYDWFNLLHNYLIPTFIIVVCCMFFTWWAAWAVRLPAAAPAD
jgi:exosortase family protein XrtM